MSSRVLVRYDERWLASCLDIGVCIHTLQAFSIAELVKEIEDIEGATFR